MGSGEALWQEAGCSAKALGKVLQKAGGSWWAPGGRRSPGSCKHKGPGVGLGGPWSWWCERAGGISRGARWGASRVLGFDAECRRSRWKALSRAYAPGSLGVGCPSLYLGYDSVH